MPNFSSEQPPTPYQQQPAQPAQPPYAQPYPQPPSNTPSVPGMPQPYAPPPPPARQQAAPPPLSPQTQKYLKTIPTFQKILQRELNPPSPLPYWIEDANAPRQSTGNAIGETLGAYFGGSSLIHIFTAHFKLPWHGVAELHIRVNRHGPGQYPTLLYTATLGRPVPGEVILEAPKLLSWAKFVGNPILCQKLNTTAFLKDLNKFARTEQTYGRTRIKISRFARLGPLSPTQSHLTIRTLPRSAFSLISNDYHFDAQQFLVLAAAVEAMLAYA